jgi:hypothetical protein
MSVPVCLVLLSVIALVLHIVMGYLVKPLQWPARAVVAACLVVVVLLLWYVVPVRVG